MANKQGSSSNFWFGFTIGVTFIAVSTYFFGTKEGRKMLKETLKAIENNEGDFITVLEKLAKDHIKTIEKNKPSKTINTVIKKIEDLSM